MKLYSYTMPKGSGLAPNPYFGYCTLATGKPIVRKCAQVGDWIAVYGMADTVLHGKLVALMRVDEVMTYDAYWEDERFREKRPAFDGEKMYEQGDNIYHREGLRWVQERSCLTLADGNVDEMTLKRDTQTNRVMIAKEFYYFGNDAIAVPDAFQSLVARTSGNSVYTDQNLITAFVNYINENYDMGILGSPYCDMNEG